MFTMENCCRKVRSQLCSNSQGLEKSISYMCRSWIKISCIIFIFESCVEFLFAWWIIKNKKYDHVSWYNAGCYNVCTAAVQRTIHSLTDHNSAPYSHKIRTNIVFIIRVQKRLDLFEISSYILFLLQKSWNLDYFYFHWDAHKWLFTFKIKCPLRKVHRLIYSMCTT